MATASGRCLPSAFGMYVRRDDIAQYAPRWTALFVGFSATGSDPSRSCITSYGSSPSRHGPATSAERSKARSPGSPRQGASAHASFYDHTGSHEPDVCARLGADAVRHSFIVADFHRLLLAGLRRTVGGFHYQVMIAQQKAASLKASRIWRARNVSEFRMTASAKRKHQLRNAYAFTEFRPQKKGARQL
jgi:hypothetical protein